MVVSAQYVVDKSQPCEPSLHACFVGAWVGASVGAAVGTTVAADDIERSASGPKGKTGTPALWVVDESMVPVMRRMGLVMVAEVLPQLIGVPGAVSFGAAIISIA